MRAPVAAALFAFAALLACTSGTATELRSTSVVKANVADNSSGPMASGHANWINAAGEYVSRTFNAREKDGVVTGNFVQHVTAVNGDKRVNKGDIDCLRIISPTDAVLSGPVEENANPALIGFIQIFREHDDGEGADARDAQSPLFFRNPGLGLDCRNFTPPAVTPIESGNIQVKP